MRFYKWGITAIYEHNETPSKFDAWFERKTGIYDLDISFCFKIGYTEMYYDGLHHRLFLGIFDIYWMTI